MNTKPIVSIYVTTYFHEKYVAQALDSIISQKVNFPIQIVISDDCSTDNTQNIILEYARKYDFIKININKQNIGLSRNVLLAKTLCDGEFITELSGDDIWIDDNKLQSQYDFLINNPEYFAVGCRVRQFSDNKSDTSVFPPLYLCDREFTLEQFLSGENYSLNGIMYRNPFANGNTIFNDMPSISEYIDDLTDCVFFLKHGRVYLTSDIFVGYRFRKDENEKNFNSINKGMLSFERHIQLLNNLDAYFNGKLDLTNRYKLIVLSGFKEALVSKDFKRFFSIYNTIIEKYRKNLLLLRSVLFLYKKILIKINTKK